MSFVRTARTLGLLATIAVAPTFARADETKIPMSEVPKAVLDTVKAKFPKTEIKQAIKEVEDGKTSYEIETKEGCRAIDVVLKPDGTILAVEKEIAVGDLPKAVAAAIEAKYPKATIGKAEMLLEYEDGKEETEYEVVLTTVDKKEVEVKLTPAGKIVDNEEKDKNEKKN